MQKNTNGAYDTRFLKIKKKSKIEKMADVISALWNLMWKKRKSKKLQRIEKSWWGTGSLSKKKSRL